MTRCLLADLVSVRTGYQFRAEAPFSPEGSFSIIQLRDAKEALTLGCHELQRVELSNIRHNDLLQKDDILLRAKGNNHYAVLVDRTLRNTLAGALCLIIRCTEKYL